MKTQESIHIEKLAILAEIVELKKYLKGLRMTADINSYQGEEESVISEIEFKKAEIESIELEAQELLKGAQKKDKKILIKPKPVKIKPHNNVDTFNEHTLEEGDDQYLNCQQIAKALKIKEATVLDWIKKQFLPAAMITEYRYMLTKEDVKSFIENPTSRMFDKLTDIDLTEIECLLGEKLIFNKFSRNHIAKILGVHRYSVFRWIENGWLKEDKVNRLISRDDLLSFLFSKEGARNLNKAIEAGIVDTPVQNIESSNIFYTTGVLQEF